VKKTNLSNNIKFLRKQRGLSQQALADQLNIKRSNIAAYESKGVEPRLRIVLELAKYFDVEVRSLINSEMTADMSVPSFGVSAHRPSQSHSNRAPIAAADVQSFVTKSMQVRKVLDGFKAFYSFKKSTLSNPSREQEKLVFDIDNFIDLMEHLLLYNESMIAALAPNGTAEAPAEQYTE